MEIKLAKGTHDILYDEAREFSEIEIIMRAVSETFGYEEIRTPIIEHSELFTRTVGESSDIVRKEMYEFLDKGNRLITLRPEFTASIVRSFVNNKLYATKDLPVKLYYCGPVFRYDRPQAGRYRQFNQFGVELIGASSYFHDLEVMMLGYNILLALGLDNVEIRINTIGDEETRKNYVNALKEYFAPFIDTMCGDCKERLKLNPLRILDCKVEHDKEIVKKAPKIKDYLSKNAKEQFDSILEMLDEYEIKYVIDDELVRGLDYYSNVVFEYHVANNKGKSLGAIGGGGHYANLVEELGGPKLECCGLSFGLERVINIRKEAPEHKDIIKETDFYVMPLGKENFYNAYIVATALRSGCFITEICLEDKSLSAMFKRAERANAKFAVIIGDDEVNKDIVIMKNLLTKEQFEIKLDELMSKADELIDGCIEEHTHHEEHDYEKN